MERSICYLRKRTKQVSREWHNLRTIKIKRTSVSTRAAAVAQSVQMGKDVNGEFRGKKFKKREKEASLHLISEEAVSEYYRISGLEADNAANFV